LRERSDDVGPLAQYFLDEARKEGHTRATRLSPEALNVLMRYTWPGNVRELRNALERAVVFEDSFVIQPGSLPPEIVRSTLGPQAVPLPKVTETYTAEAFKAMLAQSNAAKDSQSQLKAEAGTPPTFPPPPNPQPGPYQQQPGTIQPPMPAYTPPQPVTTYDPGPNGIMPVPADGEVLTLDEEEKRIILRTLSITGGNISEAARRLAVHRSTLHRKMTRYGLATDEQIAAGTVDTEEV